MKTSISKFALIAVAAFLLGCTPPESTTKTDDNTGIFGKKTQEIGEFDPNAGEKVSDSTIDKDRLAVPLIGAASAYGPIVEQITKMGVNRAVEFFHAYEGRYPKDYDEFMQKIIHENDIKLPVLPGGATYKYDVENHELVVIAGDGKAVIPDK